MIGRPSVPARTQALILAGGQGERLLPLTLSRPKPAVSFGGSFRIIDFTLSNAFHSDLSRVSLLTQYRHEDLHRYIRDGWGELWTGDGASHRAPLTLLPPTSGKRYRGTADAVFQNAGLLESDGAEFVLILSGDHVYHMDYRGFLQQHADAGADLTIGAVEQPVREAARFGVIEVDEGLRVIGFEEKPDAPRGMPSRLATALVNMGIYVFKKSVLLDVLGRFSDTDGGCDFGRHVIPSLIENGRCYAHAFRDDINHAPRYWRDIGTLDGYYETSMETADLGGPFDPYANDGWPSQPTRHPSHNAPPAAYNGAVTRSVVSPGVELGDGAAVDRSILMPGVRVGKGARLRRAIVDEGVQIPEGYEIGFDIARDLREHTVTERGVVVVSATPAERRPTVAMYSARRPAAGTFSSRLSGRMRAVA